MKPGETVFLKCKREGKITPHRYEGPMVKFFEKDTHPQLYEKFKDKHLFTCKSCKSTFSYHKDEIPEPDFEYKAI